MHQRYTKEEIQRAKDADLIDLLPQRGYRLKKRGSKEYCLESHDSLTINREKGWYWNSMDVGGNAIDFFMYGPEQLSFTDAMEKILGKFESAGKVPTGFLKSKPVKETLFELPIANYNHQRVLSYLIERRGLDAGLIKGLLRSGRIYEAAKTHNAVFLGFDYHGYPKYAFLRGTSEKRFAGTVQGSDKQYTFRLQSPSRTVHVFEATIDLLSYITMEKMKGNPARDCYLSLEGVSALALDTFLLQRKDIERIYVRLDNDEAGHKAAVKIAAAYGSGYKVINRLPNKKDYNEELLSGR